jgi:hypothetical protein
MGGGGGDSDKSYMNAQQQRQDKLDAEKDAEDETLQKQTIATLRGGSQGYGAGTKGSLGG